MKYWLFFLTILVTSSVFAACKIDQQQFGVSSQTIKSKLEFSTTFEPIPGFHKKDNCSKLCLRTAIDLQSRRFVQYYD